MEFVERSASERKFLGAPSPEPLRSFQFSSDLISNMLSKVSRVTCCFLGKSKLESNYRQKGSGQFYVNHSRLKTMCMPKNENTGTVDLKAQLEVMGTD